MLKEALRFLESLVGQDHRDHPHNQQEAQYKGSSPDHHHSLPNSVIFFCQTSITQECRTGCGEAQTRR